MNTPVGAGFAEQRRSMEILIHELHTEYLSRVRMMKNIIHDTERLHERAEHFLDGKHQGEFMRPSIFLRWQEFRNESAGFEARVIECTDRAIKLLTADPATVWRKQPSNRRSYWKKETAEFVRFRAGIGDPYELEIWCVKYAGVCPGKKFNEVLFAKIEGAIPSHRLAPFPFIPIHVYFDAAGNILPDARLKVFDPEVQSEMQKGVIALCETLRRKFGEE